MAVDFFSELCKNCDNEQMYHFEKEVEDCMQKNVSRFYYTDIFLTFLFLL